MTSRELPRAEWNRLVETEIGPALSLLPSDTRMLVVEQDATILGAWAVIRYVHVEGVWIAPTHRKRGAVAACLLRAMKATAREMGARAVLTAALTDEVRALCTHLGGVQLPGDHFAIPIGGQ